MGVETKILGLSQAEPLADSTISLRAPGYSGRAVQIKAAGESRAQGDTLPLDKALAGTDVEVVASLLIELKPPTPTAIATGGRGAATELPQLVVPARADADYAVLHTDESGCASWLFPMAGTSMQQAVFELPPERAAPLDSTAPDASARGPVTSLMKRVVRVVAWLAQPVVGAGARAVARLWENSKRPYGLWQVGPNASFNAPLWDGFRQSGPTLLLIHGTFSTPQAGFDGWVGTPAFDALSARYGGHVLALAHPSLSVSPSDNIDWMLQQLPDGAQTFGGPLDIVCHSRGGLVARELAARAAMGSAAGVAPRVDRICQVGAPNLGTPLADASRWITFIDAYTSCLTRLPDTTTTIVLEGLLCLVKILGTGVARGLPGLAAMDPAGDWLQTLAGQPCGAARWFTVGANYEPARSTAESFAHQLGEVAKDAAVDAFFAADNDMVVPTEGCHRPGAAVVDQLRLTGGDTNHCSYFASTQVQEALARWLQ